MATTATMAYSPCEQTMTCTAVRGQEGMEGQGRCSRCRMWAKTMSRRQGQEQRADGDEMLGFLDVREEEVR